MDCKYIKADTVLPYSSALASRETTYLSSMQGGNLSNRFESVGSYLFKKQSVHYLLALIG